LVQEVVRLTEGRSNGGYYTAMQAAHILRLTPTRVRQLLQGGERAGEHDETGHWLIPARVVHERLERRRAKREGEWAEELRTELERDKGLWRGQLGG
jgi:hypothetical protein